MLEWKKLPRSIRLEHNGYALDVWKAVSIDPKEHGYRFTVFTDGHYVASGKGYATEDLACEAALVEAGI